MVSMRSIVVDDRPWIFAGRGLESVGINSFKRPSALEGLNLSKSPASMTSTDATFYRS
jgi:hypothetical protein